MIWAMTMNIMAIEEFLLHTSHVSNIYNSANYPDQSSLRKLNPGSYKGEMVKSNWADVDHESSHASGLN